jgi:ketosteroid isomerase-like protein
MPLETAISPLALIERLQQAMNQPDLEALLACFAPDYDSIFPAHPDRAFQGLAQVRKNWSQIFGALPNLEAVLLRSAVAGDTVWTEWEWRGVHADGTPSLMRGVTIQGVQAGRIGWSRLYMEPVRESGGNDAGVRESLARPTTA